MSNAGAIGTLTNNGSITGGGGAGTYLAAPGGAGVSNTGTITTLTNTGTITGGGGSWGQPSGSGGAGVSSSGAGATVDNSGTIKGGNAGGDGSGGVGGVGVTGQTLTIVNAGTIAGGLSSSGVQADAIDFTGGANNVLASGANAVYTGAISVASGASLSVNQTATYGENTSYTLSSAITGAGAVAFVGGANTITLTGANTYTGGTMIASGKLQIGNGGTTGSITGNIADSGALVFDRSNTVTFSGAISGTGSVTQGIGHADPDRNQHLHRSDERWPSHRLLLLSGERHA